MAQSYQLISAQTLTANTASVTFSNIPQNYTDLLLKISVRTTNTQYGETIRIRPNNLTTNGSARVLRAFNGTSTSSYAYSNVLATNNSLGATATANTFASIDVYILNYTSSNYKSFSGDAVSEDNASDGRLELTASLWSDSAAITSLVLDNDAGSPFSFTANSTFTLYGIGGSRASGGTITADGNYTYHTFTSTGTFIALDRIRGAEALVIAGGGGGARRHGGGGGAGGVSHHNYQTFMPGSSYAVTVGAGGAGSTNSGGGIGTIGGNSSFGSIISNGGGPGIGTGTKSAGNGGSGGGSSDYGTSATIGGSATQGNTGGAVGYGNNGGGGKDNGANTLCAGGGGGAGAVGQTAPSTSQPGAGGDGLNTWSAWATATSTGVNGYYAGGGGGSSFNQETFGAGGLGGGGAGSSTSTATAGTANTGSGGGGQGNDNANAGSGGSGLVIIRYPNS